MAQTQSQQHDCSEYSSFKQWLENEKLALLNQQQQAECKKYKQSIVSNQNSSGKKSHMTQLRGKRNAPEGGILPGNTGFKTNKYTLVYNLQKYKMFPFKV